MTRNWLILNKQDDAKILKTKYIFKYLLLPFSEIARDFTCTYTLATKKKLWLHKYERNFKNLLQEWLEPI